MNCFLIFWWMGIFGRLGLARGEPDGVEYTCGGRPSRRAWRLQLFEFLVEFGLAVG